MGLISVGASLPLELQLHDGATGKFPLAHVYDQAGVAVTGSPFSLTHLANGLYRNTAYSVLLANTKLVASYIVYNDAGHTTESVFHTRATDHWDVETQVETVNAKIGTPVSTVSADIAAVKAETASIQSDTNDIQSKIGSPVGTLASDIAGVQAETKDIQSKIGTPVSTVSDDIASVQSQASFNGLMIGTVLSRIGVPPTDLTTQIAAVQADTDDIQSKIGIPVVTVSADIAAVKAETASIQSDTNDIQSKIGTPVGTLASDIAGVQADTDALQIAVAAVNADTDDIQAKIGTPATTVSGDIASVQSDTNDIQTKIGLPVGTLASDIAGVQADTDDIQAKIGTPVGTVSSDIAAVQTKLGTPAGVSVSADIAAVKAETASIQTDTNDIQAKIGSPAGTLASDIAEVQADTDDIQAKIGVPAVTVSADIAAVKAETASIQSDTNDIQSKIGIPVGTVSSDIASIKSDSAAIKSKTDQLTFSGSNVNANAQVVSDKTGYALTTAEKNDISDRVWDEALASHAIPGSTGEALAALSLASIAGAVWDELVSSHTLPGTYGLYIDVIRQFVVANNAELLNGSHGLSVLKSDIAAEGLLTRNEVNANEAKIDAIIPAIVSAKNTIVSEVDQNQTLIGALASQISSAESNLLGEINQNEAKLDTIEGKIGTIQNNTTVRFVVPDRLIKPDAGSKTYEFRLYLYDTNGNPEAPDSAPLIRIRRLDTGTDLVVGAAMTQDGAKVGAYYYQYSITSGTAEAHLLVETTVVEGGVTRYYPATSEITEFESDLNAIQSQLSAVQSTVTGTDLAVQNPIFGLSALKSGQTAIVGEINQNEVLLNLIKGKTDLIPANIATQSDVAAVNAAVLTRPDIAAIQVRLDLLRDNLKGVDGRDLTQVYDKWDISSLAKTSDPRFAHLDAAVSSRSTLTAAQVWGYSSRILTSYGLDASAIDAIWAYLTSQATSPNSIGKRIADFLDVAISTRATAVQVTSALAGVAQETTLSALSGTVVTEANQNELKLNQVLADTATIKAKTNNLPPDPASQSLVQNTKNTLQSDIANLDLKVTGVKAKTDNLPIDPAKETSVQARPTNPVLTTDTRLNRLDVNVSSRGTVMPSDLTPLAKTSDVSAAKTQIISEINSNESKIDSVQATANQIKAKTDTIPTNPASFAHINQAEVNILDAIDDIPGGGGGPTAAQIWSYASRTLTQDPSTFGPDISGLAEKTDLTPLARTQYVNRMTTSFNNLTSEQEILAWAEQDGQRILGENCTITVKDHLGATVWTGTLATPSADGVFRFQNNIAATGDSNYYVEIDIEVDGDIRRSRQTFVTVG